MENEKRLIDANALVEQFSKEECRTQTRCDFIAMVHCSKTVDAVEVVNGRWVVEPYEDEIFGDLKQCLCSICGYDGLPPFNYCPNCGAKMDGDVNALA